MVAKNETSIPPEAEVVFDSGDGKDFYDIDKIEGQSH